MNTSLLFSDLLTPQQLADMKGKCLKTVYCWIHRGIAPAYELDRGRYWFHRKPAEEFQPPKPGKKAKA